MLVGCCGLATAVTAVGGGRPAATASAAAPPAPLPPTATASPSPSPSPSPSGPGSFAGAGTVRRVLDGDTIEVADERSTTMVRILGIDAPDPVQCWAAEATEFARRTLLDHPVTLFAGAATRDDAGRLAAYVLLSSGRNYSLLAAEAGAVRVRAGGGPVAGAEIVAAEARARAARSGLWGAPCEGGVAVPSPPPAAQPAPPPVPAPPRVPAPPPAEAYYPNCDAARRAGAAPLHRGQPGYRSGLDRDGDGVACE
jgi:micrococcal nuclease